MEFYRSSSASDTSDEVLISEYQSAGDSTALANLYGRYTEMIYYVCLRYLSDPDTSKDAVMQVFEHILVKAKTAKIENFGKWIYVVAKNHCLMILRSAKHKKEILTDNFVELTLPLHPEEDYNEKERRYSTLEDCIATLVDKQRESIRLFYLEEKCYKEIAESTGFSLNEVKSYIQNGKRNLKICIEKNG